MFTTDQLNQVSTLLTEARSIILIVPPDPSEDTAAAAVALAAGILAVGGKDIQLVSPVIPTKNSEIFEHFTVRTELGNKQLQVSFPYDATQVDKVSYNIDDSAGRFYLTIQPQKGSPALDYNQLEYAYIGADADLIILVGVPNYEVLDQVYIGYEDLFKNTTVISLNNHQTSIGLIKLDSSGSSSLAEATIFMVKALQLPVSSETATILLKAIESATQSLTSYAATADTFEMVAYLLRQGARRVRGAAATHLGTVVNSDSSGVKSVARQVTAPKPNGRKKSKETVVEISKEVVSQQSEKETLKSGDLHYQPQENTAGARG